MRFDSLPIEFQGLQGKVNFIQRINRNEWSSSCPECGGTQHQNGDPPDRFRMWTNATGKNRVMGWCRHCSFVWFPDHQKLDPASFEKWRQQQIEIETRRKQEAEEALQNLRSKKIWELYHKQLNAWAYEILDSWGICKDNAEYWKLGMIYDYMVYPDEYHSPAISIPVWGFKSEVRQVKVRILNPQSGKDRYRSLYKLGKDIPFVARHDFTSDTCLLVEGEKKAMVAAAVKQDIQVIGIPSKTPSPVALKDFDSFGKIFVCLDPDARIREKDKPSPQERLVDLLGKERVAQINIPAKLDDYILKHNFPLEEALRYAK